MNAEGQCPCQLAIQIHGATAHACNYAGIFRFRTRQPHQDDVALGTIGVFQNSQNFHSHGFRFGSLENGVGNAMHAGVNRADRNGVELFGSGDLGLNVHRRREEEGKDTSQKHTSHVFALEPQALRKPKYLRPGLPDVICRAGRTQGKA